MTERNQYRERVQARIAARKRRRISQKKERGYP